MELSFDSYFHFRKTQGSFIMNKVSKYGILVTLAFAFTPFSYAGLIEGQLFNTGLNSTNGLISGAENDANWITVVPEGGAVAYYNGAYAANGDDSQWISIAEDGANNDTTTRETVFSTTFDLTGYDESTAMITGLWGVDNSATIFLNNNNTNVALEFGTSSFSSLTNFSISDLFVSGINTLTIELTNGYPDLNRDDIGPLALRFDDLKLTAIQVPEPGTLALIGIGLAGLGFSRRKKA